MNKIQQQIQNLAKEGIKQPEVCMVRPSNYTGPYIDVEKINAPGFQESTPNTNHYIPKVRLTIDQTTSLPLTYNVPIVGSRVLVIWTVDEIPIAIQMNQVGNIIKNYTNQTVNVNNTTMVISGTTTVNSYQDINITDNGNINISTTGSLDIKNNAGAEIELNNTGLITIKNSSGDLISIMNNILICLSALDTKLSTITGPVGCEATITQLVTQISTLLG